MLEDVGHLIDSENKQQEIISKNFRSIKDEYTTIMGLTQDKKESSLDDPKIQKISAYKSGARLVKSFGSRLQKQKNYAQIKELIENQEDYNDYMQSVVKKPRKVRATPVSH